MAIITATRYNNLRSSVDPVLGVGTGNTGYGQSRKVPHAVLAIPTKQMI